MIAIVLVFPAAADTARLEWLHAIKSYLFIPHVRPYGDAVRPILSLGWSLNYEMYFYFIFGLLLFLPLNRLMMVLTCFFLISVGIGYVLPESWVILNFWGGGLLAYCYIKGWRLPRFSIPLFIFFGLSIGGAFFFPVIQNMPFNGILRFLIGTSLVAAITLPQGAGGIEPPRFLTVLGDSSYSLYLAHPFGIGVMRIMWEKFLGLTLNVCIYIGITVIVCLIGAHIAYLLIEKPLIKWSTQHIRKPS